MKQLFLGKPLVSCSSGTKILAAGSPLLRDNAHAGRLDNEFCVSFVHTAY